MTPAFSWPEQAGLRSFLAPIIWSVGWVSNRMAPLLRSGLESIFVAAAPDAMDGVLRDLL